MALVDFAVFRQKGRAQVQAVVYKPGYVSLEDCSRVHHALIPRLEEAFPGQALHVEVSSPGINRTLKDAAEFRHYIGRGIRCFRTDISDWAGGVLESADETGLVLTGKNGAIPLGYDIIAKAKLDYSQEA
jgi:ribosome maturation factor RimP